MSDQTFTVLADFLVAATPISDKARKAFVLYQKRFQKQVDGEFAVAFELYFEALCLESDPTARSFIHYNVRLLFFQLNQKQKALLNLNQSLDLNPSNPSVLNILAILYFQIAESLLNRGELDQSDVFFERARQHWKEAHRIAPYQYLEAENWLQQSQ